MISTIIGTLGLLLGGFSLYCQIAPSRAVLGVFIDHPVQIIVGRDTWEFAIVGKITNDSPHTAQVLEWNLILDSNMTHQIVSYRDEIPKRLLASSEQADFTIGRTLIGENNTSLPTNSIRSFVVTFIYEDYLGLQSISKSYLFE